MQELFDSRSAIAAASDLDLGAPRRKRSPLPSAEQFDAMRREWSRQGCVIRRGPNGATVYRFGHHKEQNMYEDRIT